MARDLARVSLNMGRELLEQVDEWAESVGISRSAAVSVLCSQMLATYKMTNGLDYAVKTDLQAKKDAAQSLNSVPEKKVSTSYTESILCREK